MVLAIQWDGTVVLCQKKLAFDGFSHPVAERIWGLYAKCTLHLAFDRPIADAQHTILLVEDSKGNILNKVEEVRNCISI